MGKGDEVKGENIEVLSTRAADWLGDKRTYLLVGGRVVFGETIVGFSIIQGEEKGVDIVWDCVAEGSIIGGRKFDFDCLVHDKVEGWMDANPDEGGGSFEGRISIRATRWANGEDIADLTGVLCKMEEWIKNQDFYKDAVIFSNAWQIMDLEKAKRIVEEDFYKALEQRGHGVLLKHPDRAMREWAIKNIGKKRSGR